MICSTHVRSLIIVNTHNENCYYALACISGRLKAVIVSQVKINSPEPMQFLSACHSVDRHAELKVEGLSMLASVKEDFSIVLLKLGMGTALHQHNLVVIK